VLNIGLQANILDSRSFSMFVVHALILTFMTTPLVLLFYPTKYRLHQESNRKNADDETAIGVKRFSDDAKQIDLHHQQGNGKNEGDETATGVKRISDDAKEIDIHYQ
jgi:hypothetical protein